METLDARGNLSALNRFDFSVKDFLCDEGASLSYTVRPRMSPGVGEMEGWDPNFSPQVIVIILIAIKIPYQEQLFLRRPRPGRRRTTGAPTSTCSSPRCASSSAT